MRLMRLNLPVLPCACGLAASLAVLTLLSACGANDRKSSQTNRTSTTAATTPVTTTTAMAAPATTRNPRTQTWIDLQVGDCLAELPPSDPSVVTVTVVDCATAHAAEVYLRGPLAVNAAIADVANRECASGFQRYAGQSIDGSSFAVTYLIDSDQDRTSDNPAPSTVICLLHAANGQPLTESARR
jgi:archaellin